MLRNIAQLNNVRGRRVLLRLDLNVPIVRGKVADDFRIQAALPTVSLLRDAGAKVILLSHIEGKAGAAKSAAKNGAPADFVSLKPVADYFIEKRLPVTFVPKFFVRAAEAVLSKMKDGDVVLFENLRSNPGETKNDPKFAAKLAAMGEIYVNEAFPVSHRPHASIVGLPAILPSYVGPVFMREVKNLSQAFAPERPFLFVLGGAKFDTKMPLIQKFLALADFVFVGGALANNFFKELGFEIGQSTVSDGNFNLPALLKTQKVFIPTDVVVAGVSGAGGSNKLAAEFENRKIKNAHEVKPTEKILDVGPESLVQLGDLVKKAKFVLWNGPLGDYEDGYSEATKKLAEIVARANAKSVVGGGDTVAAIQTIGLLDKFSFVSTGGGAMLDFLANETLPGIQAIENNLS